ncbi:hypothetical protein C491_21096 [Natronococcus amylolyticus DSM 10524]|uniref:DUF3426 domain-containing protein n=1 Tax=Natronococcus amylolyticus DSM 10524 TaxID=1227497 RepID=L9WW69_9EURY|nr:FxLYD domain-containing protein [Natronococcus amylolyticus]ELY53426.1 hypothetical protein C491_21096 [Natronococcus amylolyticus DSM 10524]
MHRRDAIAALGIGMVVAPLSGCLDFAGMRPDSDNDGDQEGEQDATGEGAADGDRDNNEPEANDSEDDAEETDETEDGADSEEPPDPVDVEQRDAGEDVLEFGGLQITDYEEHLEEFEYDEEISYTGEVENVGDEAYESVAVEVRVYDEDGEELGNHRDLTPELGAGETWRFEIAAYSRPEEIADHDIAVVSEQ